MYAWLKCAKLAAIGALFAAIGVAAPSSAAPVTVNLRIEGRSATLFEGGVTTDAKTITTQSGGTHRCDGPGGTPTTALDDAALANGFTWDGSYSTGFADYFVNRIGPDANTSSEFWGLAVNFRAPSAGGCQITLNNGDQPLWGYDFFSKAHLLKLTGTGSANVGEPVTVTVTDGQDGTVVPGASVGGQTTGPTGAATLSFGSTGVQHLKADRADSVRSNALDICVHNGNDGLCGASSPATAARPPDVTGPVARIAGLRAGARFSRRRAPRLLKGTVDADPSGVRAVYIRLWRHYHRRCYFYSGASESLRRAPCASHRELVFAGPGPSWSYLLPFALPPGHYRVDAIAVDRLGNGSPIVPGRNRVDFYVR